MRRRPTSLLTLLALLLGTPLVLGGCSVPMLHDLAPTSRSSQAPVQVSGATGEPPVLDYDEPYDVKQAGSRTVWPGTGDELVDGDPVLLNMYAEDGRDRSVISSTYVGVPRSATMSPDSLGSHLYDALRGQRVGARLLILDKDAGVPVVLVVDVLPTRASGTATAPVKGLPTVVRAEDGAPTVTVPRGSDPPADLQVQPLVRGTGPQVKVGQLVTMRFTAVRWGDGKVFDTTWGADGSPQSVTIGIGQVIDGLDTGLVEQTVGSQVLLVVPPSLGYGGTSSKLAKQTLVYVVDILDAHYQAESGSAEGDNERAPEKEEAPEDRKSDDA